MAESDLDKIMKIKGVIAASQRDESGKQTDIRGLPADSTEGQQGPLYPALWWKVTNSFASSYEAELDRKWQPGKWTIFAGGDHIVYVNARFIVFTGADADYKEVMDGINAL